MGAQIDTTSISAAKVRSENFPVASHFLPSDVRTKLLAVYGFARLTDDVGDEASGDRLAQLDQLAAELAAAAAGHASHPVFVRLAPVLAGLDCGLDPFYDLIEANRLDQHVTQYATFDELRGYCMRSAAPVGRIVLSIFGATTPDRVALADDVCVGLQLVEHLQDVGEDARVGRVYLPQDELREEGCDPGAVLESSASPALRRVVLRETRRAEELLAKGIPLAASLPWRAQVAVVGFAAGGRAACDSIRSAGGDVLLHRFRPTRVGIARRTLEGVRRARRGRPA